MIVETTANALKRLFSFDIKLKLDGVQLVKLRTLQPHEVILHMLGRSGVFHFCYCCGFHSFALCEMLNFASITLWDTL
jgi:hypothetical protein